LVIETVAEFLDYVPEKPSKPNVRKLSSYAVKISCACTPNGGSDIDKFKIVVLKTVNATGETSSSEIVVNDIGGHQLEYTLDGLELETKYQFQINACNAVGSSPLSELSDVISLGI
jgi:hypothetical protein